jgi:glycosyltransferase involved in cell wall biosynthesis
MKPISVIVHTKNSEATLLQALKSVEWCNEIIVADMQSTDNTLSIARRFSDNIVKVKDTSYVEPVRNQVVKMTNNEWVLILDSDEMVSKTLAIRLKELTEKNQEVWQIPRKNIIWGEWLQHGGWWPDYQYHFFKQGHVVWSDKIHEKPTVKGLIGKLPANGKFAKIHYNYPNVESYLARTIRYSRLQAEQYPERYDQEPYFVMLNELMNRLVKHEGYLDGGRGYNVSLMQGMSEAIAALRVWETNGYPSSEVTVDDEIGNMISVLNYWRTTLKIDKSNNVLIKSWWQLRRKLRV